MHSTTLSLSSPSSLTASETWKWGRFSFHTPPPERFPKRSRIICAAGGRKEDDYHDTLRALKSRGRYPRKSLGQHYMLNSSINEQLAYLAEVKEGDVILEIGPGTGSLTNVLLNAGAVVVAVEKVLQEDFTKCRINEHLGAFLERKKSVESDSKYAKVVSNIPFNISTDVVKLLLPMGNIFSEVILLLQDETASRFADAPLGTPEYRPINIFVNFYSGEMFCEFVEVFDSFLLAVMKTKSSVNSAFNGKRKMLRKSLQHICTSIEIEKALEDAGLPATEYKIVFFSLLKLLQIHSLSVANDSS
ncbi:hypothetical protein ACLOJK_006140 [Asimina triloba]